MPRAVERCLELPLLLGFCQVTVEWPQDSDDREDVSYPGASDLFSVPFYYVNRSHPHGSSMNSFRQDVTAGRDTSRSTIARSKQFDL
jgi:hypothetical protein